jgi:hypothetical protein
MRKNTALITEHARTNDYRSFFESVVLGREEEEGFVRSRRRVSAATAFAA